MSTLLALGKLSIIGLVWGHQAPLSPWRNSAPRVLTPTTDAFINSVLSDWNTPGGVSVAVVRQDDTGVWHVETKGYGNASLDGTPMTDEHLFGIASNSKLFNIIATGLLISNESLFPRLSWHTKIASVVPEWGLMDPLANTESEIIDLMSHRTGQPRHDLMYGRSDNISSILQRMKYLKPSAGFRDIYQYNNNMYMTLSSLPELVLPHRPPFARYVKENIFDKLGLNATTYSIDVATANGNLAQGMARQNMKHPFDMGTPREMWFPNWFLDCSENGNFKAGAGGIISSAKDIAIWLHTLLLGGKHPQTMEQVIPESVIEMVSTGITVDAGKASYPELSPVVYGGAQSRYSYRGHEIIEHGGSTTGKTQVSRFPVDRLGIAALSNDDEYGGTLHQIIKWYLADIALGMIPINWNGRMRDVAIKNYSFGEIRNKPINPPSPSLQFSDLGGSYEDPGYGALDLCYVSNSTLNPTSASCTRIISEAAETLPGIINDSVPTFLAKWEKVWSTHVKLEHFAGNVFNLTTWESRRIANIPEEEYWAAPVHSGQSVVAEFAFQDGKVIGIGLTGGIWGAGERSRALTGATLHEQAEVWFDKT